MMERKTFYHPAIMPSDKMKILLGVATPTGKIMNFQEHYTALHTKICELILSSWTEGENVPDLVEGYLGVTIDGGGFQETAHQILETPQMIMVLLHAMHEWHMLDIERDLSPAKISRQKLDLPSHTEETFEEGQEKTKELMEDISLRYFLEHLSMAYEDLE